MIVVWLLVVGLVLAATWLQLYRRKLDQVTANIPELPGLPLLGGAHYFLGNTEKIFENLQHIAEVALKDRGIIKLWLGTRLYVALANPEDAQIVLENCLAKDVVYRFMQPWLGQGLFVAPLSLWKAHRKVLLPVFSNRLIEEYVEVFAEQARLLNVRLAEQAGGGEFDVLPYITACTLDIVFETAMGERMEVQKNPETEYLRARSSVMSILNMRLFKVWMQPDCIFNLTPYAKLQAQNIDLTHKFTDAVVKKRRAEYERNKLGADDQRSGFNRKVKVVLDMLFGREIEFTDEQLREHIDSITIAGNDTTALVIAYTLVLLGVHRYWQEKVYQEQKQIFGDSCHGASKEDLQAMPCLERVIKESMRLYTVVPLVARAVDKDTQLSSGVVPAGAGVVIGAWAIHRSKKIWGADADEFDPDRFLPERSANRHPAAFLPFSYGSRNCIGRNFGMLIMKSIISSVIRTYKVKAESVGKLRIEMLLFPIKGHLIQVEKR